MHHRFTQIATMVGLSMLLGAPNVQALETSLQLVISLRANAEQRQTKYACEGVEDLLPVTYLNADPDFLAVLPVDGEKRIFVSAISASGVRYVSGQYVWWTKGAEASLFDEMSEPDAPALFTCLEANNIP